MLRSRQSAFTIVELMITLAVATILVTLAIPSIRDLIDKSRLRGATDDIVNLLNTSRGNAVKLQRDVNVSVSGTTTWCAGAVSAATPAAPGTAVPVVPAPCDCTASTVACLIGDDQDGYQQALVSSTSYSGVTLSTVNASITDTSGSGGITFNSKYGALYLGALPAGSLMTVSSPTGKYSTQISVSALGQVYVCVPSGPFVAGYPSC